MLSAASLKRVIAELRDLSKNTLQDIHILINEGEISDIVAYIHGPEGTPFEGGVWKIRLYLGSDFPSAPPKGVFVTKIFHPNVSSSGEICVDTLKKDWNQTMGIRHVLLTIKCLLIHPNPESALNEEAGRLLLEKYEDYCRYARLMTSIHARKIKWEQLVSTTEENDKLKRAAVKENDTSAKNISFQPSSTQKSSFLPRRPKNSSLKRL